MTTGINPNEFPRNRRLKIRRRLLLCAIAPLSYVFFLALRRFPTLTEVAYTDTVGNFLASTLSFVSGVFPVALAEWFIATVFILYTARAVRGLRDVKKGTRQAKNLLTSGGLILGRDAGVTVGLFYLLWGFNYALAPLPQRLGWSELTNVTVEELDSLVVQTTDAVNAAYLRLHGTPDVGTHTMMPPSTQRLHADLRNGWRIAREMLGVPTRVNRHPSVKTPLLTKLYELFGVAGFYFPFTGEANVRANLPAIDYPRIVAPELPHQRGVTRESEANFWGFLSAAHSNNPLAEYSAYRLANRQMVIELARLDIELAREAVNLRLPGVRRDIEHSRMYWESFRGTGTSIGNTVNNAFLRSNRVEGGVRSYSMSSLLFISYARARGGLVRQTPGGGET